MKQAFIYNDNKSQKFWIIDSAGNDIMVNFGKLGTNGRFQITEYNDETECQKAADKLIAQKTKKGYKPAPDFNFIDRLYFDDEDYGLHRKTSHPHFVRYLTDDFYYDCGDEEAPFGSDEGSDTLSELAQAFRKNNNLDPLTFPQKLICEYWGMDYLPPQLDQAAESIAELCKQQETEVYQSDKVIIATAFGSIKITGRLKPELQQLALLAMQRLDILAQLRGWCFAGTLSEINQQMADDLQRFAVA
mgnify:FL=1